uniref:Uncharacterized protein n=1 Tax=Meloidogyne hapla TaxID=6305 RepID=A0A1I8BDS2_MELHA
MNRKEFIKNRHQPLKTIKYLKENCPEILELFKNEMRFKFFVSRQNGILISRLTKFTNEFDMAGRDEILGFVTGHSIGEGHSNGDGHSTREGHSIGENTVSNKLKRQGRNSNELK